jgi:hypothetical protein
MGVWHGVRACWATLQLGQPRPLLACVMAPPARQHAAAGRPVRPARASIPVWWSLSVRNTTR